MVISHRERRHLDACLASLLPQCSRAGAELIVVRAGTASELAALIAAVPEVHFVHAPADANAHQLRGIGMAEANGDIVALTEDVRPVYDGWVTSLLAGDGRDAAANGKRAGGDQSEWTAYFAEHDVLSGERAPLSPS